MREHARAAWRWALLVLALAALAPSTGAGTAMAGSFDVAWSPGTMSQKGWSAKTDNGAPCAYFGALGNAASLQAGTLPAHGACFALFDAPADSTISSVHFWGWFHKGSANPALCAHSFADVGSPNPLNLCADGTLDGSLVNVAGGKWFELGVYNSSASAIGIATSNANNTNFSQGWVTLDDPSAPSVVLSGTPGTPQGGSSFTASASATDLASSIARIAYRIDSGPWVDVLADGCSDIWACGQTRGTAFGVGGLDTLADGPHTLTVSAWSAGGAGSTSTTFWSDHTSPTAAVTTLAPDAASFAPSTWWGHAPLSASVTNQSADVVSTTLTGYAAASPPPAPGYHQQVLPGLVTGTLAVPAPPAGAADWKLRSDQCDAVPHCTAGTATTFGWDSSAPPATTQIVDGVDWFGAAEAAGGSALLWPPLAGPAPLSGVHGAYLGVGGDAAGAQLAAAAARQAGSVSVGVPGSTLATLAPGSIAGRTQVCLAAIAVSEAGVPQSYAASSEIGYRCEGVDEQPPTVAVAAPTGWTSTPPVAHVTAADSASGVASLAVTLDGQPIAAPAGTVSATTPGVHDVAAVATDRAGNASSAGEAQLRLDVEAPTVSLPVAVDPDTRTISLTLGDAQAGVDPESVRIWLDGSPLAPVRTAAGGNGTFVVELRVPDGRRLAGAALDVAAGDRAVPANAVDTRSQVWRDAHSGGRPVTVPASPSAGTAACPDGDICTPPYRCPAGARTCAPGDPCSASAPCPVGAQPAGCPSGFVCIPAYRCPRGSATCREGDPCSVQAPCPIYLDADRTATSLRGRARARGRVLPHVRVRLVRLGTRVVVEGALRGGGAPLPHAALWLVLRHPRWADYSRHWSLATRADGTFHLALAVRGSGRLRVLYLGDRRYRPSTAPLALLRVRPALRATFAVRRVAAAGDLLSVRGRFAPAAGPPVVLRWQARPDARHAWQSICTEREQVRPGRGGRFSGTCRMGDLRPSNQYRLAVVPTPGLPYALAASAAVHAARR